MTNRNVSVCIPTYNGAAFLAAAIDSVLHQTYPHFEIWVLDDNSPDDTEAVVAKFSDERVRYVRNSSNLGPEGNWNKCLELAQGKYFKLLPHDDLLAPDCLEKQVEVLEQDTTDDIGLVFGSRQIIGPDGRTLMTRGLGRAKAGRIDGLMLVKRCVRSGTNQIGEPGNGLFRTAMIKRVGSYDATYPYLVDLDYWFRILICGAAYYTATHSSSFRVSKGSWSVAIGGKQYHDFKGFVDKFHADARYRISTTDRAIGLVKARINTLARAIFYRYLFAGK